MLNPRRTLIVLLLAATASCATMAGTVRDRAAADYHCEPDSITVEELPGNAYHATGCGREATYSCQTSRSMTGMWGQETSCQREGPLQ